MCIVDGYHGVVEFDTTNELFCTPYMVIFFPQKLHLHVSQDLFWYGVVLSILKHIYNTNCAAELSDHRGISQRVVRQLLFSLWHEHTKEVCSSDMISLIIYKYTSRQLQLSPRIRIGRKCQHVLVANRRSMEFGHPFVCSSCLSPLRLRLIETPSYSATRPVHFFSKNVPSIVHRSILCINIRHVYLDLGTVP